MEAQALPEPPPTAQNPKGENSAPNTFSGTQLSLGHKHPKHPNTLLLFSRSERLAGPLYGEASPINTASFSSVPHPYRVLGPQVGVPGLPGYM